MNDLKYSVDIELGGMLKGLKTAGASMATFAAKMGRTVIRVNTEALIKSMSAARTAINEVASAAGKLGSLGGIVSGFALAAGAAHEFKKSIGEAADMETLEVGFGVLLGSVGAAKERLADLSKFAAATPFELPEVARASRMLQVLTKGALATGSGLTLVGDVAAGVQQPFEEIAVWVGRLYDGLKNGAPVGEAMQRLGELGAVSGDTRRKIEALQEGGADFATMWTVVGGELQRFSGMMGKQSETWNGLMSTLKDGIGAVHRAFGEPLIDALKPMLKESISLVEGMAPAAAAFGQSVAGTLSTMREMFQSGTLFEAVGLQLKIAFADAHNFLIQKLADGFEKVAPAVMNMFEGIGSKLRAMALDFAAAFNRAIAEALPDFGPFKGQSEKLNATADSEELAAGKWREKADEQINTGGNSIGQLLAPLNFSDEQLGRDRARLEGLQGAAKLKAIHRQMDQGLADPSSPLSRLMKQAGGAIMPGGPQGQRAADNTAKNTGDMVSLLNRLVESMTGAKPLSATPATF